MILQDADFKPWQEDCLTLKESDFLTPLFGGFENKNGSLMYVPNKSNSIEVNKIAGHVIAENNSRTALQLLISCGVITSTGYFTIVGEGRFMSYIPLFIALTPVLFWSSKIVSAYFFGHFFHPRAISYSSKSTSGGLLRKIEIPKDGANFLDVTLELLQKERSKNGK